MLNWVMQRQSPRYLIQLPLLHQAKAPASSRVEVGWTRDLSEGGACLELSDWPGLGVELDSRVVAKYRLDRSPGGRRT